MKSVTAIIVISLSVFGATSIYSQPGPGEESPSSVTGLTRIPGIEQAPRVPPSEKKKKISSRRLKQISGRITAIDRTEKTITVQGIKMAADEETLANLKEGDSVKVDYYSRGVHKAIVVSRELK